MKVMKNHRWPAVIASSAAVLVFLLAAGASRMSADTIISDISVGNTALSGFTGTFATVTVTTTSPTTATVTFTSNTVNGNVYLLGDGGTADLNVNGSYTLGTVTETNTLGTGFSPSFKDNTPGTVDGFGNFNLSLNNNDGFSDAASSVSFTLTNTSGTWSSASNVLTTNAGGWDAAAHIFVCAVPCTASEGAAATGFAAEAGTPTSAPEPGAVTLLGFVLLAFVGLAGYSRRKLLA